MDPRIKWKVYFIGIISIFTELICIGFLILEIFGSFDETNLRNHTFFLFLKIFIYVNLVMIFCHLCVRIVTCCSIKYQKFMFLKLAVFIFGFSQIFFFSKAFPKNGKNLMFLHLFGTAFASGLSFVTEVIAYNIYNSNEKAKSNQLSDFSEVNQDNYNTPTPVNLNSQNNYLTEGLLPPPAVVG